MPCPVTKPRRLSPGSNVIQHKKHELEIELSTEAVFEHGKRAAQDAPNNYDFLVEGFVNNIRYLARKITTMGPPR